ncbi:DUF1127 domain-containing protein [Oricola sp.]|uniref:DUF1127 domain-containing protein n=1 Tax=Oricola sp. TaxID=1979950 RepID=UPI003BAD2FDD
MVSIDTMKMNGPVRIGDRTFASIGTVPLGIWIKIFAAAMRARMVKQKSRRHLRELTDDQLTDIGVTRQQAWREADKPFWYYDNSRINRF